MNKLKTLKDLSHGPLGMFKTSEWVERKQLKQEAIKRIKACYNGCSKDFRCKACNRDMWFYDLTEDELK